MREQPSVQCLQRHQSMDSCYHRLLRRDTLHIAPCHDAKSDYLALSEQAEIAKTYLTSCYLPRFDSCISSLLLFLVRYSSFLFTAPSPCLLLRTFFLLAAPSSSCIVKSQTARTSSIPPCLNQVLRAQTLGAHQALLAALVSALAISHAQ